MATTRNYSTSGRNNKKLDQAPSAEAYAEDILAYAELVYDMYMKRKEQK